jgi:hypothetical protein
MNLRRSFFRAVRTLPPLPRASALSVVGAALVAACVSAPPTRFHTLMLPADTAASAAHASSATRLSLRIEPVHVPAQVDRPEWVVRGADGEVHVLEQQRWVAPLGDEWRDALGAQLSAQLDALDLSHVAAAPTAPAPYRLQLEVQRFDTVAGHGVRQQTVWTLSAPAGGPSLSCRSAIDAPATAEPAALAAAHRQALRELAQQIAATLRALAHGDARCPT